MSDTSNSKPDIDHHKLLVDQVSLLYQAGPLSLLATVIYSSTLVYIEWDVAEHTRILTWFTALIIVSIIRFLFSLAYQRTANAGDNIKFWKLSFETGTIVAGLVWGSSAFLIFPDNSPTHQMLLAVIIAGISAGAVTTLSPLRLPVMSLLALMLIPLIIRFFMIGDEASVAVAMVILFYYSLISISALRIHSSTKQNIQLRLKSEQQEEIIYLKTVEQRAILDNAPVGIWQVSTDGRYQFINSTFCNSLGFSEEQFLKSTNLADLIGEKEAATCLASDIKCLQSDSPQVSIEELTFTDGKRHLLEVTKAKIQDENGSVKGLVGIGIDITDKQIAQNRLRKLSQAIDQAGESIVITDKNGLIEYVNPAFSRITGYSAEEALSKNPSILKSGKQSSEYYRRLWDTISHGKVWNSAVIDRRRDGTLYPALMTISPIFDEKQEITHYVGIQQDMTDHNILEEQFRQAQKMEALGTLVGGIAHDFNNILTGISGNITLAKFDAVDSPDLQDKLKIAEELSFKAAEMIKRLMTFSRKGLIDMKPFGLISFLENIYSLIRTSIPENITFNFNTSDEELVVRGDSTQIEQVLINLLNNARDAVSESNNPAISLTVEPFHADPEFVRNHPDLQEGLYAHVMVSDNGIGIDIEDIGHIFEPFFTTKEVGLGTGLGLSMAYGAIKNHRGILQVESTTGEGTTFHIYFPALVETDLTGSAASSKEVQTGDGELILIVDDNADVRNAMKRILSGLNYQVIEAVDGLEAVDLYGARKDDIDLVISDVVMPRLGGVKAVERMRDLNPQIKVIFTTGYDRDDALKHEMPAEEYPIIAKPFNISSLSQEIRKQLQRK